jgi:purine catabolism regulator
VSSPLAVVVAVLDPPDQDEDGRSDFRVAQERFANAWVNVVTRFDKSAPVVGFAQEVVAIAAIPPDQTARTIVDGLVHAVSGDGGGGRRSFATGVSRVIEDPAEIADGYEQARRAVQVGRQLQGTSAVAHFDDLGAFRLLSLIEDTSELTNFVEEVLGELADEANAEAADMRATLRVLLDSNFNVAETSRRLHFHYNTLRYRITKLEKIVGPFVSDPDLQLDLSLALRVMQMRGL